MTDTRARLLTGALWIALGRISANALGVISTIVLARMLVPDDFGLVAICVALLAVLLAISEMPLAEALIQHDDPREAHFHTAWTMSVIRSCLTALVVLALTEPVVAFYGDERLRAVLWVMAGATAFSGLLNPKLALFQRELVFRQLFFLQFGEKLAGFLVAVSIALIFRSYWALVLGSLATEIARVVISYVLRPYRPRATLKHYREILSFSVWVTLGNWVQAANWRADPLLFGAVLPTALLGQYSFGQRVTRVIIGQLAQPVQQTLFPAFARSKANPQALQSAYLRAQGIVCLWIYPFAFGLAITASDVVEVVLGAQWLLAVPVMQALAFNVAINATVAIQPVAMATGHTRALFIRDLRAFAIRWPLILAGLWFGSDQGPYAMLIWAMVGNVLAKGIVAVWSMLLVRGITGLSLSDQISVAIAPGAAVLVMALAETWMAGAYPAQSGLGPQALRLTALIGAAATWLYRGDRADVAGPRAPSWRRDRVPAAYAGPDPEPEARRPGALKRRPRHRHRQLAPQPQKRSRGHPAPCCRCFGASER